MEFYQNSHLAECLGERDDEEDDGRDDRESDRAKWVARNVEPCDCAGSNESGQLVLAKISRHDAYNTCDPVVRVSNATNMAPKTS